MPTNTTNLGLTTYNATTDGSALFLTYRTSIAGVSGTSNMGLIDAWAGLVSGSLITLSANKPIYYVSATYDAPNYYEAISTTVTSYVTNQIISLVLDTTSNGTVTLRINALDTKTLVKVDQSGNLINFNSNELKKGREYLFRYDGSQWVWISPTSIDQISSGSGAANNIIMISGCGVLIDSGVSINDLPAASGSYVVLGLNPTLDNEWLLSSGSGTSIVQNASASTVRVDLTSTGVSSGSYLQVEVDVLGRVVSGSSKLKYLDLNNFTNITINTGSLTFNQSVITVIPESGTTDDVVNIYGLPVGTMGLILASGSANEITFKHGTGNIYCPDNGDLTFKNGMITCVNNGSKILLAGGGAGGHILSSGSVVFEQQPIMSFQSAQLMDNAITESTDIYFWNKHKNTISASTVTTIEADESAVLVGGYTVNGTLDVKGKLVVL